MASYARKNWVVLIDIENVILNGGPAVWARHDLYAQTLKLQSSVNELLVASRREIPWEVCSGIVIGPKSWLGFIRVLVNHLRQSAPESIVLVAGTPWNSGLAATLIRALIPEARMQVQLHADVSHWTLRSGASNCLKRAIAAVVAPLADSVRCVTRSQAESAIKALRLRPERVFVASVPLALPPSSPSFVPATVTRFAVVGRLHSDRGLVRIADAVRCWCASGREAELLIAGEGPDAAAFLTAVRAIHGLRVRVLGQLQPQQLWELWSQVDVLLSLPPAEAYGRAIREALCCGVPVLASDTAGARDLLVEWPDAAISILPESATCDQLVQALERQVARRPDAEALLGRQAEADALAMTKLVNSWIRLGEAAE